MKKSVIFLAILLPIIVYMGIFYPKSKIKEPEKLAKKKPQSIQYFCTYPEKAPMGQEMVIGLDWNNNMIMLWLKSQTPKNLEEIKNSPKYGERVFTNLENKIEFSEDDGTKSQIVLIRSKINENIIEKLVFGKISLSQTRCPWENKNSARLESLYKKNLASVLCHKGKERKILNTLVLENEENKFILWTPTSFMGWALMDETPTDYGTFQKSNSTVSLKGKTSTITLKIEDTQGEKILKGIIGKFQFSENECPWLSKKEELDSILKNKDKYYCSQPLEDKKLAVIYLNWATETFEYYSNNSSEISELLNEPLGKGDFKKKGSTLVFKGPKEFSPVVKDFNEAGFYIEKIEFKREFCHF